MHRKLAQLCERQSRLISRMDLRPTSSLFWSVFLQSSIAWQNQWRKDLQSQGILDLRFCLQKNYDGRVALPILLSCLSKLDLPSIKNHVASSGKCDIVWSQAMPRSKRERTRTTGKLINMLQDFLESYGESWTDDLKGDIPHRYQRHGDLIIMADNLFSQPVWKKMGQELWPAVAEGLGAKRLAQMSHISRDGFRTPMVTMLLGEHSWVTHIDNGIRYDFDVTRSMFSAGNITEKLRVAAFDCRGETVVDLYAGIGYFTLPYLVHAGASHIHACEWNPDSVIALKKNLEGNRVSNRCTVHYGDNRQLQLSDVADRVNLGLIPSSEEGWPVACGLLKRKTGGILHIHQNVTSPAPSLAVNTATSKPTQTASVKKADRDVWQVWADDAANRIASLLKDITCGQWTTSIQHIEHVKSYAPHIHHVVLDLECRPL